ncbi:MAG: single-stranded DNA-binding protein, partial [Alphaproteobacteria bacterium]|nr:single-stranded DNA-binding protein [Alphaproteobacteria bacterium]
LGRDPEVRTFSNGGRGCGFSVATSERWKAKNTGELRERTEWHRISIFAEPLVKLAEQYLQKGSQVYLEGQLETRKWTDKEGNERQTTEVVLRPFVGQVILLGGRGGGGGRAGGGSSSGSAPPSESEVNDLDDEIPF